MSKTLMVQGTASSAGKSVITAGLCRYFCDLGLRVAPFKAQNMSLNSFVTAAGGEMGRAQVVQSWACRIPPRVEMNPILLKPESHSRSQVVVMGKVLTTVPASEYFELKASLLEVVERALATLRAEFDLVVIEGAGSPAEVNLRDRDIANMRVAELADAPVLLVGDIDRGGVIAALVGTLALLRPPERERVKALIVNKFRGQKVFLESAIESIRDHTGKPVLGAIPFIPDLGLPEEDSVGLDADGKQGPVAVIRLPHIANFDDFDPLPVRYVTRPEELAGAKAIVIPGTKTTIADLRWLRQRRLDTAIQACQLPIAGICGGFQMLGREIVDPEHVESDEDRIDGLGLLPVTTTFERAKTTTQVRGVAAEGGFPLVAYQIHMGQTVAQGALGPFARLEDGTPDGAVQGRVLGTYLHGLFHNDEFRRHWLREAGIEENGQEQPGLDGPFERLAGVLRETLDLDLLHRIVGLARV
ncbi:MAG: cobyric acid synthase [Chloroflexota bacterium]|nr:cobyric acid synthase [Chloroflexota bacterium]